MLPVARSRLCSPEHLCHSLVEALEFPLALWKTAATHSPSKKKKKIKKELSIYRLLPDLEENGGWKVPCSLNPKRYLQETKKWGGYDVLRGDCHPELWLRQRTQGISTKGRAALSHCTGQSWTHALQTSQAVVPHSAGIQSTTLWQSRFSVSYRSSGLCCNSFLVEEPRGFPKSTSQHGCTADLLSLRNPSASHHF